MIELVTNLEQRGQFGTTRDIANVLPYRADLFRSYYSYDQIDTFIGTDKNFREYNLQYSIRDIILDVDGHTKEQTLDKAKAQVIKYVNWLLSKGVEEDNFQVWFSGGGFHIHIAASLFGKAFEPSPDLPEVVRNTMLTLFPEADNIYYPASVIRVGHSYNLKRAMWKIPVSISELQTLTVDEIKTMAKEPRLGASQYSWECFEACLESFVVHKPKGEAKPKIELGERDAYSNVVTCMHKLYDRGPVQGRRHTDMLRLASWMRRAHLPETVIYDSLTNWADGLKPEEVGRIVKDVFDKDYRYGCNDSVRSEFCDSRCVFYARKDEGSSVMNHEDMNTEMIKHAVSGGYQRYVDLKPLIGQEFKIYPGEMVVISGESGLNKSTFAQQIAILNPESKIYYISTEVSRKLMYRRFLQQATMMDKEEIYEWFQAGKKPPGSEKISHILLDDAVATYPRFMQTVLEYKPDIIFVDVIEDIGEGDSNDNIAHNGPAFKALAMQLDTIIIPVAHMRKSSGRKSTIKSNDDVKGSAAVIQKADKVILLEGDPHSTFRRVRSSKSRDERPFSVDMQLDIKTFNLILQSNGN